MKRSQQKVTPIRRRPEESEAQDREDRMRKQGGRSVGESAEGRAESNTGEQGITNRDLQEETARQAKVMPFRDEGTAGKRKTGGKRQVS